MNTAYTDYDQKNKSANKEKPQSGLIPITATMIQRLNKFDNTSFEFEGIPVHDVIIMGNLVNSIQEETKIKLQIYDVTGLIDVTFYDRNESDTITDISRFVEEKYIPYLIYFN
jgi:uncharacterized protein YfkK (UPF0435 family)